MSEQAVKMANERRARPRIPERSARAFRAYLEVWDTAIWFRHQVGAQLGEFGLNMERFRMLEMLWSEGPMTARTMVEKRSCSRQSLFKTAEGLAGRGLLQIESVKMPAREMSETKLPKSRRGRERVGRTAAMVRLTDEGGKFMRGVMRRHTKLVYALMRAVGLRELDHLSETCRKIREGDPFRLIHELMMEDPD